MVTNKTLRSNPKDENAKKRPRGRPRKIDRQLEMATNLIGELQLYVKEGLDKIGANAAALIEEEIRVALHDDDAPAAVKQRGRHFLLKLMFDNVPLRGDEINPLTELLKLWQEKPEVKIEVQGDAHFGGNKDMASEGEGHPGDSEGEVVEGAWRTV